MSFTQDERRIAINTPLGKDVLLLTTIDGVEEMSRPFTFRLDLISENDAIKAEEIVGKPVTITFYDTDDEPHFRNGYVRQFVNHGQGDRASIYSAEVVPWLWFLTRRADCRIFQDKTVPQVIEEVFQTLRFTDYDLSGLSGSYPKLDYCVQYRETDFAFVSRLMEREGIFYYFRHEENKHVMVLGDSARAYEPCKDDEVRFAGPLAFDEVDDNLRSWEHRYEYRSGRVAFNDYNFETPQSPISANEKTVMKFTDVDAYELFDYPGLYMERGAGDARARLQMEVEEAGHDLVAGGSICRSFSPGRTFKVTHHHVPTEEGKEYVLTAVHHRATAGSYVPGGDQPEGYQNDFTCVPSNVPFRPSQITKRGIVRGPQTAVVVGPAGEEIYTDKYGRVKVQFFWDRYGQRDENSSCWIRVAHSTAGQGWGAVNIPRIGQEVVVEFLEGDPDRPLITGRVYNADQTVPYGLPGSKTQTGIKSRSSPGGGGDNYNEIRFEDKKGKEEFVVHAEKDFSRTVKHDSTESVKNNKSSTVDGTLTQTVKGDATYTFEANLTRSVGSNESITVSGTKSETVNGDVSETFSANTALSVGSNQSASVGGNAEKTVGGKMTLTVGGNLERTIGGSVADTFATKHSETCGATYELTAPSVKISGMAEITLAVGPNMVKIDPSGVTIMGVMVRIN